MIKYLGSTDSVNACDCCGKPGLKKTVEIEIDGEAFNYGTTCAGRALGIQTRTVTDVKAAVDAVNERAKIRAKVDALRAAGNEVVYGRFYISDRSAKTELRIQAESPLLIHRIY